MSKLLSTSQCRIALQVCAVGAVAALMSGCSSDVTRFGDPFGNPFSTASADQPQPRRHLAGDVIPAGRTPPVTSQALAPRSSVAAFSPPHASTQTAFREPVSSETTGSIEPGPIRTAASGSSGGWSSAGGTPVQVADGDTADILAKRYGVPATALLQVNGLRSAADIRPGSRITIPIYSAGNRSAATAHVAEAVRQPEAVPANTLRLPHEKAMAERKVAERTVATASTPRSVKQQLAEKTVHGLKPSVRTAEAKPGEVKMQQPAASTKQAAKIVAMNAGQPAVTKAMPAETAQVATVKAAPVKTARLVAQPTTTVAAQAEPAPAPAAAPAAAVADNNPEFRWPARGRIIQGFKGGSGGNDGINIAVPEGTAVKAAEGGVVAYAGSELKGYGNLILIRHPNGFVSAYANNGEIDVKRGETVKRGQMIAKSGQSGNVSSPQLHFELRKGSTPVDPTQYLAGL